MNRKIGYVSRHSDSTVHIDHMLEEFLGKPDRVGKEIKWINFNLETLFRVGKDKKPSKQCLFSVVDQRTLTA